MSTDDHVLHVQCACGARLRAPASAVGRRVRCPRCTKSVTVERLHGEPRKAAVHDQSATAAAPQPARSAGEKQKVLCSCGTKLAVPASAAGRRVRCPKCRAILTVPAAKPQPIAGEEPELDSDLFAGLREGQAVARPAGEIAAAPRPARTDAAALYGIAPEIDAPRERPAAPTGPPVVCPACQTAYPPGTRVCTRCGVNIKTGRSLITREDEHINQAYASAEAIIWWISFLFPTGLYPVASEAFGLRKPWVVRGLAVLTIAISAWYMVAFIYNTDPDPQLAGLMCWVGQPVELEAPDDETRAALIEEEGYTEEEIDDTLNALSSACQYRFSQLFTSMFLHADPIHLLGNLLFLMVLGTRVNALIGNVLTLVLYPLLGAAAVIVEMVANANEPSYPALGASGAIMGLAGMYLILFPVHKVHMAAWLRWGLIRGFRLSLKIFPIAGFWMVLFYIAFDVAYTAFDIEDGTAHWAHLGGFGVGVVLAIVLMAARLVDARGGDVLSRVLGPRAWVLLGKPGRKGVSLW
ncbi:MAG: rhomboid family intramembrane serine protease [Phycisphaerae bacterium]|jgi:membrane associated rhomboid family serine protease